MWNYLEVLHSNMRTHIKTHSHLRKKVAIVALLLTQATSFVFNGKGFSWSYPLKEVSKNECRKIHWDQLSDDCKQPLPEIDNANYNAYVNNPTYRLIYSVLWGGTYNDGWDNDKGGHEGVDFVSSEGTPVYSVEDGVVIKARAQAGYGNVVVIKHTLDNGNPVYSTYGHLSNITIPEGMWVNEGDMIGRVGHEGLAYGDHLHFVLNTTADNTYAFRGCPDLSRGEIAIGNLGLCRNYLTERTVDPIAWIESQGRINTTHGILADTHNHSNEAITNSNTTTTNNKPTGRRRMPIIPLPPVINNTSTNPAVKEKAVSTPINETTTQKPTNNTTNNTSNTTTTTTTRRSLPSTTQNTTAFASVDSQKKSTGPATIEVNNSTKLGEDFLTKYNVDIDTSFGNSMTVGQTSSLVVTVTDKNTGAPYVGMLPKEITIIPSEALFTLSPQVIRLTNSEGKALVLMSANRAGTSDLVIFYNMKSFAKIAVSVK